MHSSSSPHLITTTADHGACNWKESEQRIGRACIVACSRSRLLASNQHRQHYPGEKGLCCLRRKMAKQRQISTKWGETGTIGEGLQRRTRIDVPRLRGGLRGGRISPREAERPEILSEVQPSSRSSRTRLLAHTARWVPCMKGPGGQPELKNLLSRTRWFSLNVCTVLHPWEITISHTTLR